MDKKQKEFVKTKELVNKIVSYATEMIGNKFEYKHTMMNIKNKKSNISY